MNLNSSFFKIVSSLISVILFCQTSFAAPPSSDFPTIKQAQKVFPANKQKLVHGGIIRVRAELNDLLAGDFVTTVVVYAKAGQSGAKLELIADQAVVDIVNLPLSFAEVGFTLNMRNGQDYQRLLIRSIGKSEIQVLTANVGDPNADTNLPPLPPPPDEPPPFVQPPTTLPPQGPAGLNEFSANCKTRSHGVTFYDQTESGAIWYCQNAVNSAFQTNGGECQALAECKNPRMHCSTSSNGIPVIGYSLQSVISKCQAHPQTNPSECANLSFARCEGSNNGPFPLPQPPPQPIQQCPMNAFDPNMPCQTKSKGCKFSSFFLDNVIDQCQQYSPFTTNAEECRTVAFCSGNQGQFPNPPPFPGGGHVGPLPGGNQSGQCTTFSKGIPFSGSTRAEVVSRCQHHQITNNFECEKNVNQDCESECFAESRGLRFYAHLGEHAAAACRANLSTNDLECNETARFHCPF